MITKHCPTNCDWKSWDIQYELRVRIGNETFLISQDEIDALEVNLEHGYTVDTFIVECLKARIAKEGKT